MLSKAQVKSLTGLLVLLIILEISIFNPGIGAARAGDLASSYNILKNDCPEYVQKLKDGGASDGQIEEFLTDLDTEVENRGPLTEANFNSVLYKSLAEVIIWKKHRAVFRAMNASFGEEIDYTLQTGTLHPNMVPLRDAVKASVLGCPDPPVSPVIPNNPVIRVSGVELDQTNMTLESGAEERLTAAIIPENAANKNLSWLSDNPEIAAVDQEGNIKALSAGTALITVTTEDGAREATCTVVVTEAEPPPFEGMEWAPQSDIALDYSWTIEFNRTVDQSTVNSSSIYITDSRGNMVPLSFEFSPDYRSIIASPGENYEAGQEYYLYIDGQVKATPSDTGSSLNEAVRMKFTTVT